MTLVRRVTIVNRRGLHARAAAKFAQMAAAFDAEVVVAKDSMEVPGGSIMGLMMLAASPGCEIELRASGKQAQQAIDALTQLIADRFNED